MTISELRDGDYIRCAVHHVTGGGYSQTYRIEKRLKAWPAEDGWWAVDGTRVTFQTDGSERTSAENIIPVSTLRLEMFEVVSS